MKTPNLPLLVLLFFVLAGTASSQNTLTPIPGNLYGQAIVASGGYTGARYEFAATINAIYARGFNATATYFNVFSPPGSLHITSYSNTVQNGHAYRAVLLKDAAGKSYVMYNKINAPAPDSVVNGPVELPALALGNYTRILAGKNLYAYAYMSGGPPPALVVSRDGGLNWQSDLDSLSGTVIDLALDTFQNLFVVTSGGIYKQLPADSNWVMLNSNSYNAQHIFIDRLNRIIINTPSGPNTYRSTDDGSSFIPDTSNFTGALKFFADDAHGNLYAYANFGSVQNLYKNSPGTGQWTPLSFTNFINLAGLFEHINCISGDSLLTIGANGGMYTSSDQGGNWLRTNNGIRAADIYSIITQPDGRLECSTDFGIFYKDPADTMWHASNPGGGYYPGNLLFNDPAGNIFVAVAPTFGSPYPLGKSTDNGLTFTEDSAGLSDIGGSGFYIDEKGARHFYNYYATGLNPLTVWTSAFGTTTWNLDTAGLPVFTTSGTGVKGFCGDGQGYIYASLDLVQGDFIYRRPVNGSQWVIDTMGLNTSYEITVMASNPAYGIILASGSSLYRRTGSGWVLIPTLSGFDYISTVSVDAQGKIFAAMAYNSNADSNEVYYTADSGATWHPTGMAGMNITGLTATGDTTYALTLGNWGYMFTGGFYTAIAPVTETAINVLVFPNPSVTGNWLVKTGDEWVGSEADVFDMSGKLVYHTRIINTNTEIDAPALAAGVYVLNVHNTASSVSLRLVK
ncbi:MAG TPA: T9SS type A sorting domain-containing protein [Chitinophagales bacterium]|nr:T9SS type A sorting domain-containing protein [Chitinophagales bacterium]